MSQNGHNKQYLTSGHSNGSAPILEGEISQEELARIFARRAQALAKLPPAKVSGETLDLIVFRLNGERYGLTIDHVQEVCPLVRITPVPRTPNFVIGIISTRGRLVSVVDLRAFFGLPGTGLADESKIIVATASNCDPRDGDPMEVGLLADEVEGTTTINKSDLEPALATQVGDRAELTRGVGPGMVLVLDLNALFDDRRFVVQERDL